MRHWTRYRDGMSHERGRCERQGRSGNRRAWGPPPSPYGLPGAGGGIAYFEDNPDDVQLTVTAKRAVAEVHSPDDFGEFAYLAITSESLDEIAEGPTGQLRFLLNIGDLISGIRGIAIEKSDLSVEVTPRETDEIIRHRHSAC